LADDFYVKEDKDIMSELKSLANFIWPGWILYGHFSEALSADIFIDTFSAI